MCPSLPVFLISFHMLGIFGFWHSISSHIFLAFTVQVTTNLFFFYSKYQLSVMLYFIQIQVCPIRLFACMPLWEQLFENVIAQIWSFVYYLNYCLSLHYSHCPGIRWCGGIVAKNYKKLRYRRGTARCVVLIEILPIDDFDPPHLRLAPS